jgi:hypothetical protein
VLPVPSALPPVEKVRAREAVGGSGAASAARTRTAGDGQTHGQTDGEKSVERVLCRILVLVFGGRGRAGGGCSSYLSYIVVSRVGVCECECVKGRKGVSRLEAEFVFCMALALALELIFIPIIFIRILHSLLHCFIASLGLWASFGKPHLPYLPPSWCTRVRVTKRNCPAISIRSVRKCRRNHAKLRGRGSV